MKPEDMLDDVNSAFSWAEMAAQQLRGLTREILEDSCLPRVPALRAAARYAENCKREIDALLLSLGEVSLHDQE